MGNCQFSFLLGKIKQQSSTLKRNIDRKLSQILVWPGRSEPMPDQVMNSNLRQTPNRSHTIIVARTEGPVEFLTPPIFYSLSISNTQ